jgi:hypothetical protein
MNVRSIGNHDLQFTPNFTGLLLLVADLEIPVAGTVLAHLERSIRNLGVQFTQEISCQKRTESL